MSSINNYRELGPEDYLAAGEKDRKANKAGDTSQNNLIVSPLIAAESNFTITDSAVATINPNTMLAESDFTVADNLKINEMASGAFEIGGGGLNTNSPGRYLGSGAAKPADFRTGTGGFRLYAVIDFSDIG